MYKIEQNIPLTPLLNDNNISTIQQQILSKKGYKPHFATSNDASHVITDMDHFPYTRYYRGVYNESKPIVLERESGFRVPHNNCYSFNKCKKTNIKPNNCFETACSTVFPCYPSTTQRYSDKEALDIQLNDACIVQYR
tara:strand:+ start:311 stop:724 length:414 start_codon:yes stop_codon:yes gene_type:complete